MAAIQHLLKFHKQIPQTSIKFRTLESFDYIYPDSAPLGFSSLVGKLTISLATDLGILLLLVNLEVPLKIRLLMFISAKVTK